MEQTIEILETETTRPIWLDLEYDHRPGHNFTGITVCAGEYVEVQLGVQDHCETDQYMVYTDHHTYSYGASVTVDDYENTAGFYSGDSDD